MAERNIWRSVTRAVADPTVPGSLSARARRKRWQAFTERFPDLAELNVIDLGGTPHYWRASIPRPRRVTLVNIDPSLRATEHWMRIVVGDASEPPVDERFDLVVSNSLLEHIPPERRALFAQSVRKLADRWWIQTPNRNFPVEPHWLFPGFQFLPFALRVAINRYWPLGHRRDKDAHRSRELVSEIRLLSARDLRQLFPESEIWIERFGSLAKSLVAVRRGPR